MDFWRTSHSRGPEVEVVEAVHSAATPHCRAVIPSGLHPQYVVKVSFLEWTPGGTMRHPVIEGLAPLPLPRIATYSKRVSNKRKTPLSTAR